MIKGNTEENVVSGRIKKKKKNTSVNILTAY